MSCIKICGIYKITSPTGRVYIGQSKDVNRRQNAYKNSNNIKEQTKIYNSIIKHGWKNHIFEIIEECDFDNLNCRERYWQDQYDVLNTGLNCILTNTEELKRVFSKEECQKRSERVRGENNPNYKNRGVNHHCYGTKYTPERLESITGGNNPNAILMLNISTGIYYETIKEACDTTSYKYYTFLAQISGKVSNRTEFIKV